MCGPAEKALQARHYSYFLLKHPDYSAFFKKGLMTAVFTGKRSISSLPHIWCNKIGRKKTFEDAAGKTCPKFNLKVVQKHDHRQ